MSKKRIKDMRKLLLLSLVLLLFASFASATLPVPNGGVSYYNYSDNFDLWGTSNGTQSGALTNNNYPTFAVSGDSSPSSYFFDGSNDYFNAQNEANYDFTGDFSISVWINWSGFTAPYETLYAKGDSAYRATIESNTSALMTATNTDLTNTFCHSNAVSTGVWTNLVFVYDDTGNLLKIYKNGVLDNSCAWTKSLNTNSFNLYFGDNSEIANRGYNGLMDEVQIFNKVLNTTEIQKIYNYGTVNPITQAFTITASDFYTTNALTTFNATVNGTFYQTTNGTIVTGLFLNETELVNMTVEAENYQTNTTLNYNISTSGAFAAVLVPDLLVDFSLITPNASFTNATTFNVTWTQAVSPTNKTVTYNVSLHQSTGSLVFNASTTALSYDLNLSAINAGNYYVNVTATENSTNVSYSQNSTLKIDKTNYLYFYDASSGNPLVGGNITIVKPSGGTVTSVTNSYGYVQFQSFTGTNFENGTYNITFEDLSGYQTPITFTETYATLPINESFNISITNFNISLYYRSNNSVFDKTTQVVIEGVGEFTVTNGSLSILNASLSTGDYTIRAISEGYQTEQKIITFDSQTNIDTAFYMLETTANNSATITIRVVDNVQTRIQNAEVNLLEYNNATLSYESVSQCYTDSSGECSLLIELNTKTYIFTASKEIGGATSTGDSGDKGLTFSEEIVGGVPVTFEQRVVTIIITSQASLEINPLLFLQYDINENFDNVTNTSTASISFETTDGSSVTVCVSFYETYINQKVQVLQKCSTGNAGIVTPDVGFELNGSKNYVLEFTANGVLLESYSYQGSNSWQSLLEQNAVVQPIILVIWLALIGFGLIISNVPIIGMLAIAISIVEVFLFPNWLTAAGMVLKILLALEIIYMGRKKEDFN